MLYGQAYTLNEKSTILIYGAATTGAIIYHNLVQQGFYVVAFIDKRAVEIDSYYDLPVWDMKQAQAYYKENNNVVTIIAIKNVFEHEKIARILWNLGCKKILFRPYQEVTGKGTLEDATVNEAYSKILLGEYPGEAYMVEGYEQGELTDKAILKEMNDEIIANIPAYYVFTDNYENKDIIWGDIPCFGLITHMGLFRLFAGQDNDDYEEYMKFCRQAALRSGGIVVSKAWEESVYLNRLDVFNHMEYAWEHDRDFFVRNAVEADYNDKGYFNIKSGKHRIIYMLIKGSRYIPLRLQKEDYKKWSDYSRAVKLRQVLIEVGMDAMPIILGNPYFYDYPCNTSDFYGRILIKVIEFMYRTQYYREGKFDFSNQKVLFHNTPMALYVDVFRALGFEVDIMERDANKRTVINAVCGDDSCNIAKECDVEDAYFLAFVQESNQSQKVLAKIQYKIIITEKKNQEQMIVSGLVDGRVQYAYLES